MPQPNLVPLSFSSSRTTHNNGVSGSLEEETDVPLSSKSITTSPLLIFLACKHSVAHSRLNPPSIVCDFAVDAVQQDVDRQPDTDQSRFLEAYQSDIGQYRQSLMQWVKTNAASICVVNRYRQQVINVDQHSCHHQQEWLLPGLSENGQREQQGHGEMKNQMQAYISELSAHKNSVVPQGIVCD